MTDNNQNKTLDIELGYVTPNNDTSEEESEEESEKDIIKELKNQIKELEKELEKKSNHGDKMTLRELIKKNKNIEIPSASKELLDEVKELAKLAQDKQINNNKFKNKRINECGNAMEPIFTSVDKENIIPLKKSTGYPDRELKDKAYIEIKLVGKTQLDSTLRSFYISTLDKINKSLPHILVAFIHDNGKLGLKEPIVKDIRDIELTLKCEWSTSNKYLYFVKPIINFIKDDILQKSYRELQKLCKHYGIKAIGKTEELKDKLIKLL